MWLIRNMKIRTKLIGAFVLFCAGIIFIGFTGMTNMKDINDANDIIYSNNYLSTTRIQDAGSVFRDIRLYTERMINEKYKEKYEEYYDQVSKKSTELKSILDDYQSLIVHEEDQIIFDELKNAFQAFEKEQKFIFKMAGKGKFIEATNYNISTMDRISDIVQSSIDKLVEFNVEDAQKNVSAATGQYNNSSAMMRTFMIVICIAAILIGFFISIMITRPMNAVRKVTEKISNGNLSVSLPQRYVQQKDEVGKLSKNVQRMKESLNKTVLGIKDATDNLDAHITSNNNVLTDLNDQIKETASAAQQLSASMEQTGAAAQEMNTTAFEIETSIQTVVDKAEGGAKKANDISERAAKLDRRVVKSKEKATKVFEEIKEDLTKALEESEAVNEINLLADAILEITSQTNLLSLNASIEAARAGSAGRGFGVVANEISKLAENSQKTVNEIQNITSIVKSAVQNLSERSNTLLNFVAEDVTNDYEEMITSAKAYRSDAIYIRDMANDLNAASEEASSCVNSLLGTITDIAQASQEGAKTTAVLAEQTTGIKFNAETMVENMEETKSTSNQLLMLVDIFKTE